MTFRSLAIFGCALASCTALLGIAGVRVNTTKSIPVGVYLAVDDTVLRDTYVQFCPPDTAPFHTAYERGYIGPGSCPGGYGYLFKKVVGLPGDTVTVTPTATILNGSPLPNSQPLHSDSAGRPLLPWNLGVRHQLATREVFLMSDVSRTSFDARYYGPVPRSNITTVIMSLFTWE